MMQKFYVIYLVFSSGEKGFLIDGKEGILVSHSLDANIKQFISTYEAKKFIVDNQLERKGTKAYVRSNEDLVDENTKGVIAFNESFFYIESEVGEKLYFDTKQDRYYFGFGDVGFCCWKNESDAKLFVNTHGLENVKIKTID